MTSVVAMQLVLALVVWAMKIETTGQKLETVAASASQMGIGEGELPELSGNQLRF